MSWSFGREFVDDAVPALFAIATPRSSVAAAKFPVLGGWALLTVVSTVLVTVIGGLLVGLDMDPAALRTASRVAAGGSTGRGVGRADGAGFELATRLPAGIRRSGCGGGRDPACYRHGRRGLVPLRNASAVDGMGGPAAASQVSVIQLLLPLPVAAIAIVATLSWWRRAEAR